MVTGERLPSYFHGSILVARDEAIDEQSPELGDPLLPQERLVEEDRVGQRKFNMVLCWHP